MDEGRNKSWSGEANTRFLYAIVESRTFGILIYAMFAQRLFHLAMMQFYMMANGCGPTQEQMDLRWHNSRLKSR